MFHANFITQLIQNMENTTNIQERLEYLRQELRQERISYGELFELQSLAEHIEEDDVELLEAAGVPEDPEERAMMKKNQFKQQ